MLRPGSRRAKSVPSAWTGGHAVALDDPRDSLRIVSIAGCAARHWQQGRRRRNPACETDLRSSLITPLTRSLHAGSTGERFVAWHRRRLNLAARSQDVYKRRSYGYWLRLAPPPEGADEFVLQPAEVQIP